MTTGTTLRAEGQADVLAADVAGHRRYASLVAEAVEVIGSGGATFTAEDVREWLEATYPDAVPHSPNVLPAQLGGMASARRIVATGHVQCKRPSRRAGWMRAWRLTP